MSPLDSHKHEEELQPVLRYRGLLAIHEDAIFGDELVNIGYLLEYGEREANQGVADLARQLKNRNLPITRELLAQAGINGGSLLTHEDFAAAGVIDILNRQSKQWISIEDVDVRDKTGVKFDAEEVGDELIGTLIRHPEWGLCLEAPDHVCYKMHPETLAPLEAHGGVDAFIGKEIVVRLKIDNNVTMELVLPVPPEKIE